MKKLARPLCVLLCLCLTAGGALAAEDLCAPTVQALLDKAPEPAVGATGGEWGVLALARWGGGVPQEYFDGYYQRLTDTLAEKGGVLHTRKYSEYSRVVLALTAMGKDPGDVGGYDLLAPLADVERTTYQGVNGAIFALLALDAGGYDVPGVRQQYVEFILDEQLPDGGFTLAGERADPDVTAMALQALAPYRGQEIVGQAVQQGVARLSEMQKSTGGYEGWGADSCESTAQVIIALGQLGIPLDDERFVKDGNSLLDNLLSYRLPDGAFSHTPGGEANLMATEQAACALVSAVRQQDGRAPLYTMNENAEIPADAARQAASLGRLVFHLVSGL